MSVPTQRVVIPKGLINPYSTTIVEIPPHLQHADTVIAKPKISSSSTPIMAPHHRITERRSFSPCREHQEWGYEAYNPYVQHVSCCNPHDVPFEEGMVHTSRHRCRNFSVLGCQHGEEQQLRNHLPVGAHEDCFAKKAPAVSFSPSTKLEGDESEYPSNDQYYHEGKVPHPEASSRSRTNSPNRREVKYRHEGEKELLDSLGQLESSELQRLMEDLNNFQNARRKLVFDTTSLAGAVEVSQKMLLSHQ